jgi:HSP20 family protein
VFDDFFNLGISDTVKKPVADIVEKKDRYLFNIELPGFDEKEIDVKLDKDVLTIHAERKAKEEKEEDSKYIVSERFEKYSRSFILPENADPEKIVAKFDTGILALDIVKKEKSEPKKIEIKK